MSKDMYISVQIFAPTDGGHWPTHEFINGRQCFMRLSCYWQWISLVACGSTRLSPRGKTATLTMLWRDSWSVTTQTRENVTSISVRELIYKDYLPVKGEVSDVKFTGAWHDFWRHPHECSTWLDLNFSLESIQGPIIWIVHTVQQEVKILQYLERKPYQV